MTRLHGIRFVRFGLSGNEASCHRRVRSYGGLTLVRALRIAVEELRHAQDSCLLEGRDKYARKISA